MASIRRGAPAAGEALEPLGKLPVSTHFAWGRVSPVGAPLEGSALPATEKAIVCLVLARKRDYRDPTSLQGPPRGRGLRCPPSHGGSG